ncbi:MAG: histidine kinase [Arcobacter sp.]|nr:MAG: histidine kinase [Arcobacter sp.]
MFHLKIILFLLISSLVYAKPISINNDTHFIDLLSSSEIYIDKTRKLTVKEIETKKNEFKKNNKKLLAFGYSPNFDVWIKCSLYNSSNRTIRKIIEYDNALTTHIVFFDPHNNYLEQRKGLSYDVSNKKTVNPIFNIEINPKETVTYYIKASSHITTLIVKLKLWDNNAFFTKEIKHQIVLAIFFGAMFILAIYNLFIYFFTKDISYLYYVFYIFGIIIHHLVYVGFASLYLLDTKNMNLAIELASVIVALPVLALGFFTKSFLKTKQYPKNNIVLNSFLILIPVSIVFFLLTDKYDNYRNTITLLLLFYLMALTLYATLKKNKQAYFILFGWSIFLTSGMLMYLSSAGIFNIHQYIPYLIETSFTLEALVFSIALANKINNLQKEKDEANEKLLIQQKNETHRLSKKVEEKTKNLRKALDEKNLLLKELNHRVKNNMQTIVSLIRLQNDEISDKKLQDVLITIQNRINAMSHLHELLYSQDDISHINAYEYFEILIDDVKSSYENNIKLHLNIQSNLEMEQAIYCGLILNELITNSFKYAFPNKKGNIFINLSKEKNTFLLNVQDDGIGYDKTIKKDSLGLLLVNTLATEQLEGDIKIESSNGVNTLISWRKNEKK